MEQKSGVPLCIAGIGKEIMGKRDQKKGGSGWKIYLSTFFPVFIFKPIQLIGPLNYFVKGLFYFSLQFEVAFRHLWPSVKVTFALGIIAIFFCRLK